ncbi:hypothetical protein EVAR_92376_1 [Eumeta japonica]|uniref:Uncharacterized protein n=1 Tax=Eumeta variegata TaxID=151549 RepID=A0A4C1TJW3_EUMVA|nr:hypothetical protein EVAR_92376_1 [Eumeta japonica]
MTAAVDSPKTPLHRRGWAKVLEGYLPKVRLSKGIPYSGTFDVHIQNALFSFCPPGAQKAGRSARRARPTPKQTRNIIISLCETQTTAAEPNAR